MVNRGFLSSRTESATLVQEKRTALAAGGTYRAAFDGREHELFPVAIDPQQGETLRRLVLDERPARLLEIGLGYGFAALSAFAGLLETPDSIFHYTTLDPNQQWRFSNIGCEMINACRLNAVVTFLPVPSEIFLPQAVSGGEVFDFAIVDGNHRFDGFFVDLFYLEKLLVPGCAVFIDDYHLPGIRKAVSFFLSNRGWKLEKKNDTSDVHGWAILRAPEKREWKPESSN